MIIGIVLVARVLYAIIVRLLPICERCNSVVPRVPSSDCEERDEGTRETFERDIIVHASISLGFPEINHPDDRVHIHEENEETSYVSEGLHGVHEGVKDVPQWRASSAEQTEQAEDPKGTEERGVDNFNWGTSLDENSCDGPCSNNKIENVPPIPEIVIKANCRYSDQCF